jgi:subtilase family serine protease
VPQHFAGVITNVFGMSNVKRVQHRQVLTPEQVRTLYSTAAAYGSGFQGQGIGIGIVNFDGLRLSNAALYISAHSLPTPPGGPASNFEIITVGTPAHSGTPGGEGDLDFQMVLGAAPLANIKIYDSTGDLMGLMARISSDNAVEVVTESYGYDLTPPEALSAHNLHLALTAQGITYMAASGDEGTFIGEFDYPNYDPEVLMVGATAATTNAAGVRTFEDGWNGTGSGWSEKNISFNKLPSWQIGNGVPTNINFRLFPDLALHGAGGQNIASGAGHVVYFNGLASGFSGTSCSAPLFAGLLGTMQQRLVAAGQSPRLGRIQDFIYSQNGRSDVWFDVTNGNTGFLPNGAFGTGHAGWDFVTGWGAPNLNGLYATLLGRTLRGTIALGNWSTTTAGVPVTLQVYKSGTSTLIETRTATLASDGSFAVTTVAPDGAYDVYVKSSHWLRRKVASVTISSSGASGVSASLANGDVNGDNVVSLADFALVRTAFGSTSVSGNWNPNADLNGDGSVSLADFVIVRNQFGQAGE